MLKMFNLALKKVNYQRTEKKQGLETRETGGGNRLPLEADMMVPMGPDKWGRVLVSRAWILSSKAHQEQEVMPWTRTVLRI